VKYWVSTKTSEDNVVILAKNGVLLGSCLAAECERVEFLLKNNTHPLTVLNKAQCKLIKFERVQCIQLDQAESTVSVWENSRPQGQSTDSILKKTPTNSMREPHTRSSSSRPSAKVNSHSRMSVFCFDSPVYLEAFSQLLTQLLPAKLNAFQYTETIFPRAHFPLVAVLCAVFLAIIFAIKSFVIGSLFGVAMATSAVYLFYSRLRYRYSVSGWQLPGYRSIKLHTTPRCWWYGLMLVTLLGIAVFIVLPPKIAPRSTYGAKLNELDTVAVRNESKVVERGKDLESTSDYDTKSLNVSNNGSTGKQWLQAFVNEEAGRLGIDDELMNTGYENDVANAMKNAQVFEQVISSYLLTQKAKIYAQQCKRIGFDGARQLERIATTLGEDNADYIRAAEIMLVESDAEVGSGAVDGLARPGLMQGLQQSFKLMEHRFTSDEEEQKQALIEECELELGHLHEQLSP